MKKILCLLLVLSTTILLVGCKAEKSTTTFTMTADGLENEMVLDAEGDKIVKITQKSTMSLEGYTEDQIALMESTIDSQKAVYEAIDGVTFKTDKTDTGITFIATMDVSKKDTLDTLVDQNLLELTGDNKGALSLKATKESLTSGGWTIK